MSNWESVTKFLKHLKSHAAISGCSAHSLLKGSSEEAVLLVNFFGSLNGVYSNSHCSDLQLRVTLWEAGLCLGIGKRFNLISEQQKNKEC